jgi:PAS domain S-box-containing protein
MADRGDRVTELESSPATSATRKTLRAALLDAIWDISDDAMCSLDGQGNITSWNHSAERIFGYTAAEVMGEPFGRLFPEHLQSEAAAILATVEVGEQVIHLETEVQRKDAMPVPISLCASPVREVADRSLAAVVLARDITERQLTQATLAELESRVRESEALARVGGWLWDVRTGAVQWSDEQHRLLGVDPLDFDGTLEAHLACVHADDRERVHASMLTSVETGSTFDEEYRIVRPDGDERKLYVRASPTIGSAGTVVGLRGVGQDMTDR